MQRISKQQTYWRIENDIRNRIQAGQWGIGDMFPSRRELAGEYNAALGTVERAIANLLEDGTLKVVEGRGTFVAKISLPSNVDKPYSLNLPHVVPTLAKKALPESMVATLGIVGSIDMTDDGVPNWNQAVLRSMERAFSSAGGQTRLINTNKYKSNDTSYKVTTGIRELVASGVDAMVILGVFDFGTLPFDVMSAVDAESMPIIYISWNELSVPLSHVFYDSRFAGYQAANHLLRTGRKPLLFIKPVTAEWIDVRLAGIKEAVNLAGLPSETLHIYSQGAIPETQMVLGYDEYAYNAAKEAFASGLGMREGRDKPQWGIIAPNDHLAYGIMQAAGDAGMIAGEDYAIVGFDDQPMSAEIGLTSLRPPLEALGDEAVRQILRALQGQPMITQSRIRSQLMLRSSTALPRHS